MPGTEKQDIDVEAEGLLQGKTLVGDFRWFIDGERKTPEFVVVLEFATVAIARALFDQARARPLRMISRFTAFQPFTFACPAADLSDVNIKKFEDARESMVHHFVDRVW